MPRLVLAYYYLHGGWANWKRALSFMLHALSAGKMESLDGWSPFLRLEMVPDPTRAYFWPAVNKRPTRLWPGYFLTRPEAIFFDPKGKKLKNLTFIGEIFEIQTQTINGWPDPTRATKNWPDPGQKFLTQTHHYLRHNKLNNWP